VAAAVDRRDVKGMASPLKESAARQRDHVAAIDQAPAEAPLCGRILIKVDARGVLIEPGRDLVLGFLHRHMPSTWSIFSPTE